jgi:hypothetical protein
VTLGSEITPAPTRAAARMEASTPASTPRRTNPAAPVRWSRRRPVLGVFAAIAAACFLGAYIVEPTGAALAEADAAAQESTTTLFAVAQDDAQSIVVTAAGESDEPALGRASYEVYVKPKPTPPPAPVATSSSSGSGSSSATGWAPPAVTPDPGSAQAIAYDMVAARGWGESEFSCLVALWHKESGWRVNALNRSSGAYGIPQSLPGSKMASAGADWETNPATQIAWGLGYIGGRYGTPCGAWGHSQARGWY